MPKVFLLPAVPATAAGLCRLHISWATKITPVMPTRNKRIISKARVQAQLPIVSDRRTKQPQINALNDENIVNGTLVISVRNRSGT